MKQATWTVSRQDNKKDNGVYIIDVGKVKAGDTFSIYALSDLHIDSRKHHRDLARRHMQLAKDSNSPIVIFGDFFDAKEGRFDPRATRSKRDEVNDPNHAYINQLIDFGATQLEPYAENIAVMGLGNHETSLKKNMDIDIMSLMSRELGARGTRAPLIAGYWGWVVLKYSLSTSRGSSIIYFHHGTGGNSPVSRGAIKAHRRQTFVDGTDFVISGHIHNPDVSFYRSRYLSMNFTPMVRDTTHLVIPGYQRSDEYEASGWAVQKEFPPAANGCVRLDYTFGEMNKQSRAKAGLGRKLHHHNHQFLLE